MWMHYCSCNIWNLSNVNHTVGRIPSLNEMDFSPHFFASFQINALEDKSEKMCEEIQTLKTSLSQLQYTDEHLQTAIQELYIARKDYEDAEQKLRQTREEIQELQRENKDLKDKSEEKDRKIKAQQQELLEKDRIIIDKDEKEELAKKREKRLLDELEQKKSKIQELERIISSGSRTKN